MNFINNVVPFKKYGLKKITPHKNKNDYENALIIFEGKNIRADEDTEDTENSKNKINDEVKTIMEYYIKEVSENNYKPNDFLIVTPFTCKNPLANAVEIAINMYWTEKYNKNDFERYAIFHKSEEGSSIDLNESKDSTRIVSIHTSKGDGRNVVFVIGLDEQSLLKFSGESNNLIYNSMIHEKSKNP